jgi:hypothetical protein
VRGRKGAKAVRYKRRGRYQTCLKGLERIECAPAPDRASFNMLVCEGGDMKS